MRLITLVHYIWLAIQLPSSVEDECGPSCARLGRSKFWDYILSVVAGVRAIQPETAAKLF